MFYFIWVFTIVLVFVADNSEQGVMPGDPYMAAALVITAIYWKKP